MRGDQRTGRNGRWDVGSERRSARRSRGNAPRGLGLVAKSARSPASRAQPVPSLYEASGMSWLARATRNLHEVWAATMRRFKR